MRWLLRTCVSVVLLVGWAVWLVAGAMLLVATAWRLLLLHWLLGLLWLGVTMLAARWQRGPGVVAELAHRGEDPGDEDEPAIQQPAHDVLDLRPGEDYAWQQMVAYWDPPYVPGPGRVVDGG